MVQKNIMCPNCKNKITIEGKPGEKAYITCPKCNTNGVFYFPSEGLLSKTGVNAIEMKNITKFYGKIKGIENLTFSVKKGEIFGFLGPNGAGKTTTIRTLLGYLIPTNGEAFILGKNINDNIVDIKREVGYIPGDLNLYGHQLVCHVNPDIGAHGKVSSYSNAVDNHAVPIPHFGVVLEMPDWQQLADRLKEMNIDFIIEPYILILAYYYYIP